MRLSNENHMLDEKFWQYSLRGAFQNVCTTRCSSDARNCKSRQFQNG